MIEIGTALALDQAPVNTGWAVGSPDSRPPVWGRWRLRPWGDDEGVRLNEFEDRLIGLIEKYRVTHVFREQVYPIIPKGRHDKKTWRNYETREQQTGVVMAIASVCARRKIPLMQVLIADWRMRFIGCTSIPGLQGDAAREELKRRAQAECNKRGWWVDNPDAAEACGILNFALCLDARYERRDNPLMRRAQTAADEMRRTG